jgi:CBS-domain-containing membrane protein
MVLRVSLAAELMTANPLSLDKSTPIPRAAELLADHDLEAAPVVDEQRRLVGVVTAAACAAWAEFCVRSAPRGAPRQVPDATPVDIIATATTEIVRDDATCGEVVQRLARRRVRRLYVLNCEDELVGVVSRSDVLRHLLADQTNRRMPPAGAYGVW